MTCVVLGGGLVGTEVARILKQRGADFAVVTRKRKEVVPGVFSVPADASSSEDLIRAIPSPFGVSFQLVHVRLKFGANRYRNPN